MEMDPRERRNSVAWPNAGESLHWKSGCVGYFQVSFFADIGFSYRGDCELSCALVLRASGRDEQNFHNAFLHNTLE
jgi:hypothetical protein